MLVINIILIFTGKINEFKAGNVLKWNMWFWLSAFYYFYFTRTTVPLKAGAQVLQEAKRNSMLPYDFSVKSLTSHTSRPCDKRQ